LQPINRSGPKKKKVKKQKTKKPGSSERSGRVSWEQLAESLPDKKGGERQVAKDREPH
jgi:hypothetical protein